MLNRTLGVLVVLFALAGARVLGAQVIRGTVEDSTGMPLNDVRVTLIAATSDSIIREMRSGNAGDFSINAGRGGKYRVRLNRIGYAQQTSNVIDLLPLQIVTLRFKMFVAAQQLATVTVLERRNVTLTELMSASGFDMRLNKYPMNSLSVEQLEAEGNQTLEALFWMNRMPGLFIIDDTLGHSLRMSRVQSGERGYCFPEIYLDARLLSAQANDAEMALTFIGSLSTNMLYGLEVYRGGQLPPPSLAGLFGTSGAEVKPCGVVAVWTKAGRERAMTAERARGEGSVQVVRGRVVDFDTGKPVPLAALTLRSEFGADLERPVTADSNGTFSIHTKQYQRVRLNAAAGGYVELVTPAFAVDLEEMLTVDVILSTHHTPVAPIALRARELARLYSATDWRGFSFRRRRGIAGTFYDAAAIAGSGARTLADLVKRTPNVSVAGGPEAEAISFRMVAPVGTTTIGATAAGVTTSCKPMYFLNGELQREPETTIRPLTLAQLYAVEVYPLANEVPYVYRMGSTGCGILGVWTKDVVK